MMRSISLLLFAVCAGAIAGCARMLPGGSLQPLPAIPVDFLPLSSGGNVTYHGGPVQTDPSIYVVFWRYSNDPSREAKALTEFYRSVGGSQWLDDVAQYSQQPGMKHVSNHPNELKGVWYDNATPVPARPLDTAVQAEAVRLAKHFKVFSINAAFVVATPFGHYTPGFGKTFCAYHSATYYNGGYLSYTNLPYAAPGGPCTGAVSPPNYLSVAGHELAESQTDPIPPYGWLDANGAEIADKCEGFFQSMSFGSLSFYIQPLWSNAARGCVY